MELRHRRRCVFSAGHDQWKGLCRLWERQRVRAECKHRHRVVELPDRQRCIFLPRCGAWVVYVVSYGNYVYALDVETGAELWSFSALNDYAVGSSPAVANGVVYFGSGDSNVYALNAKTGAKIWSYTTGGPVQSSPAVANGVVYVSSDQMYALSAKTGALLWGYAGGGSDSSPAVSNGEFTSAEATACTRSTPPPATSCGATRPAIMCIPRLPLRMTWSTLAQATLPCMR